MQPYILMPATGSDPADEWHRLGVEAQVAGNLPLAQQRYQQALRIDPRHALATLNLAIVFAQSNLLNEALLTIERAVLFDDKQPMIWVNKAFLNIEAERLGEALQDAERALTLDPTGVPSLMVSAMVKTSCGYAEESVPIYNQILDKEPQHPAAGPNSCFVQTLTKATPADLLKQRQRWYAAHKYTGPVATHRNDKDPDRKLRVGYVGGDFKSHSAAFIFSRVLWHHSEQIEPYFYSTLPVDAASDVKTKRFQEVAGPRWRDIQSTSDEDADRMVRDDKIDILIDLAGHTNGGRLSLFTRKPAPVQITAWGFAHGTGCPEIDYFLADPIAVSENERGDYAEKILDLPCIVTIEPPDDYNLKPTSRAPCKSNGYITFGSYARYEKMSDECLKAFAEIMRRVPDSRMQFKDHAYRRPFAIKRIMSLMPDIAPERLLFSLATTHPDHMLAYQQCDLVLDPWPHGGGAVSLECVWMGVPILTRYGTQPSGRTAASVLTCMNRAEWVAGDDEDYIAKAVSISSDAKSLAECRKTLRGEFLESPAYKGYVEAVEVLYKKAWRMYCDGK